MLQGAPFRILRVFSEGDQQNFVKLCETAGYPSDLGGYYIRQLTNQGYIEKTSRGQYRITPKGKQQFPINSGKPGNQIRPRLTVLLVSNCLNKFVLIKRDTQPFIGRYEWPAMSVMLGETVSHAAERILHERLSMKGKPEFKGFFRRIDLYGDTVFDDKLFAVHTYSIAEDSELPKKVATGEIVMCDMEKLGELPFPSKSLQHIAKFAQSEKAMLTEKEYTLELDDLIAKN